MQLGRINKHQIDFTTKNYLYNGRFWRTTVNHVSILRRYSRDFMQFLMYPRNTHTIRLSGRVRLVHLILMGCDHEHRADSQASPATVKET